MGVDILETLSPPGESDIALRREFVHPARRAVGRQGDRRSDESIAFQAPQRTIDHRGIANLHTDGLELLH
jgi:hypothetical protein